VNISYVYDDVLPLCAPQAVRLYELVHTISIIPSHRDPASRFSIPSQKSEAAAAAGRVLLQTTNLWFGVPAKSAQQAAKNPGGTTGQKESED
jgi:hypothetical protein